MNTKTPKNLVLIAPMYPYRGGVAHFAETMYEGLQARGHTMEAVTFTRQYPETLFPGKTQYVTDDGEHPTPARRLLDTINPASWYKTARTLTSLQPDALIFHYWMPFFAPAYGTVARRARKGGTKVLVMVHNALPHERRLGDVTLGRYFLKTAHGCIVMSDAVARDLETLGIAVPVQQVVHPVYDIFGEAIPRDQARRLLGLPPSAPVLLFFGFIRKYKGLHVLLESMPRVVEALPNARLVVAGEFYDDEDRCRALVDRHGLHEHVHFYANYIPDAEVPRYFSAADVVVQPYVSATQSGVAQIAFHFDKPVILTDVGGLAEVVPHEKAGLVTLPKNPEALAETITRFFNEKMSARLTEGVRQEKQKYSWDQFYEAVEALL